MGLDVIPDLRTLALCLATAAGLAGCAADQGDWVAAACSAEGIAADSGQYAECRHRHLSMHHRLMRQGGGGGP